jgi:hypothetical protein
MSNHERALNGPSWTEVLIGAALSLVLGVVLAAAHLVLKPVATLREAPKQPAAGTVFFVEGSKDPSKGNTWLRKRQAFLDGQSIDLTEDELNTAIATPIEKPKGGARQPVSSTKLAPANDALLTPGPVNFRIDGGQLQVGVPVKVNLLDATVIVQAAGGFVKSGDTFNFVPKTFCIGSCPVDRLPIVEGLIMKRLFAAQGVPKELTDAWAKLANVSVEGKTLKLAMP